MSNDKMFRMLYYLLRYMCDVFVLSIILFVGWFSFSGWSQLSSALSMTGDRYVAIWRRFGVLRWSQVQQELKQPLLILCVVLLLIVLGAFAFDGYTSWLTRKGSKKPVNTHRRRKKGVIASILILSVYFVSGVFAWFFALVVLRNNSLSTNTLAVSFARSTLIVCLLLSGAWLLRNLIEILIGSKTMTRLFYKDGTYAQDSGSFRVIAKTRTGTRHNREKEKQGLMRVDLTVRPKYHYRTFVIKRVEMVRAVAMKAQREPISVTVDLAETSDKPLTKEERVKRYEERKAVRTHSDRKVLRPAKKKKKEQEETSTPK